MTKELRIRIFSFFLATLISFFGVFYSLSLVSYSASPTSWEDLGDDVVALKDSYVNYLKSWFSGDIGQAVGSMVDIPISWYKVLSDGQKVISPVDDVYYYLTDEEISSGGGVGRVHSGGGGSHSDGYDLSSSEVKPEVPSSFIKDIYSDYASRYMPMPTVDTYRWSYQDCKGKKSTTPDYYGFFDFYPLPPIYTYTQGQWGDKGWSSVYMLCYLYDDDVGEYYSKQYIHIYPSTSDDGSPLFHLDYYKLADNTLTYSYTVSWRTDRLFYACDNCSEVSTYSNAMDYLGNTDPQYLYSLSSSSPYIDFAQLYTGSVYSISQYVYSTSFDPVNNTADDCGFILSSKPFELVLNQTSIDFDKVPDNYVITIEGDTIYNYPITDPDTGRSTTINNFITNNYYYPDDGKGDGDGGNTTNNTWNIDFPDFITNITTSIETAITNVFVADQTVINNYNQQIQNKVDEKLPFCSDFGEIFNSFFVEIVDNNFVYAGDINKPPEDEDGTGTAKEENIIYPKWEVNINYFGIDMTLTIMDFSLYADTLFYVRIVVCIFLYVLYFANLMRYLPTLIGNVVDMGASVTSSISSKKGDDKT